VIVVLTKGDLLSADERRDREAALAAAAGDTAIATISGATGDGVDALMRRLATMVGDSRAPEKAMAAAEEWRP
jgi:ethanolamine utilization protein EutP (predicted NTPase)